MIRVIALTQFVFVTLGSMAAILLVKAETVSTEQIGGLTLFLAKYGLWLILVPIVWFIFATVTIKLANKSAVIQAVQASGVLLAVILVAVYGWMIIMA